MKLPFPGRLEQNFPFERRPILIKGVPPLRPEASDPDPSEYCTYFSPLQDADDQWNDRWRTPADEPTVRILYHVPGDSNFFRGGGECYVYVEYNDRLKIHSGAIITDLKEAKRLRTELTKAKPKKNREVTFSDSTGILTIKGKSLTLSRSDGNVLRLLVRERTASLPTLKSMAPRPDRVLKELLSKFPVLKKYIFLPGGPGKGGYSTTIIPVE